MKLRTDFVTNSSSSSYLVVFEVNDCPELRAFIAEEYGRWGTRLAEKYFVKFQDADNKWDRKDDTAREVERYKGVQMDPNKVYVFGQAIAYTNEGDTDDESVVFGRMLPEEYAELIYEGEADGI